MNIRYFYILGIVLIINFGATLASGQMVLLKDGLDAYRAGQFRLAYRILEPLANQGEAQAQFILGMMYSGGYGVELNEYHAANWFKLAAEQGHIEAQYFLARIYEQGWGVMASPEQALSWYQRCAEQAEPRCLEHLNGKTSNAANSSSVSVATGLVKQPQATNIGLAATVESVPTLVNNTAEDKGNSLPSTTITESPITTQQLLGENWIKEQPPANYTLQILSNPIEQELHNYIHKYALTGELAIFPELRSGKIWYNLIYGSFPTSNAINKARASLPPDVTKNGIWARQFRKLRITPITNPIKTIQ